MDPVSGTVYTTPETDLYLPGLLPLRIVRYYRSSAIRRDVGLGSGWTHSLAWSVEVRRGSIVVFTEDGRAVTFEKPGDESPVEGPDGWRVQRAGDNVQLEARDGFRRIFAPLTPDAASQPTVELALVAIIDRRGHRISLDYQNGSLLGIRDSVGRTVRVRRHPTGRIAAFEVRNAPTHGQWIAFATYEYNEAGDLTCAADADGVAVRFAYVEHRLVSERHESGLTFRFIYDQQGRCIETWGEHDRAEDTALDPKAPKLLADGATRAKGIFHVRIDYLKKGCTEIVDSRRVRRVAGNRHGKVDKQVDGGRVTTWQYDSRGNPVAREDAEGGITRWEYDESGRLTKYVNENGHAQQIVRDRRGEIIEVVDPSGGHTCYILDEAGNVAAARDPLGRTETYQRDDRGLVVDYVQPNGGSYAFRYDDHANLIEVRDPNGNITTFTYDSFGRRTGYRNADGGQWRFVYSDAGRVLAEYLPNGEAFRYSYNAAGYLCQSITPDGRIAKLDWGHFRKVHNIIEGDRRTKVFYDREGFVTLVQNGKGEEFRIDRDIYGDPIAEHTFDGRTNRYKRDALGRMIERENGAGDRTVFKLDPLGQVVAREHSDDTTDTYEFDAVGRLLAATTQGVTIRIERNAAGEGIRENVESFGKRYAIERGYDLNGELAQLTASFGHTQSITRDPLGNRVRTVLDGTEVIQHEVDRLGRERVRRLRGGGVVEREYNSINRMTRYRVLSSARPPRAMLEGEPEWLGEHGTASVAESFEWSPMGLLRMAWHHTRGATHYDFDGAARLVSALGDEGDAEKFGYDEADNLFVDSGAAREYGAGGRLLRFGNSEFLWDGAGRLVEKRSSTATGVEVWRFDWNAKSQLRSVTRPDGSAVVFDYDPFARRLRKRLLRRNGLALEDEYVVHYVWDGESIAHEIKELSAGGDRVAEETTYAYGDEPLIPLAQRSAGAAWTHFLIDARNAPAQLVDGRGEVIWDRELSAWGKKLSDGSHAATTPLTLPGQYEDSETGLSYNRNRYYDPETGRYTSADPIEINGGTNVYAYGTDPINYPDLYGLDPHSATAYIQKADGSTVPLNGGNPFDSTQSGAAWAALQKDPDNRWFDKQSQYSGSQLSGLNSLMSHTEKKITTAARDPGGFGPNDKLVVTGQLPPCSTCKAFMKDLVNANKPSSVEYKYPSKDANGNPIIGTDGKAVMKSWNYPPA